MFIIAMEVWFGVAVVSCNKNIENEVKSVQESKICEQQHEHNHDHVWIE